jgi:E3 ubiquitin-protein ligase HUWE1
MIQKLILSTEIEFIEIALEISSNAWLWPKTDFFHWIAVLNRMDSLLESIVKKYGLPVQNQPLENQDVQKLIACLSLTRVLWDNATNRTLYNSYEVLAFNVASLQSFVCE